MKLTEMTVRHLEERDYTYVQTFFKADENGWPPTEYFLVATRMKREARAEAYRYIHDTWPDREPRSVHLYPGNYIVKSRRLFVDGCYPQAPKHQSSLTDTLGV